MSKVTAIHDDDLTQFLTSLGILEKVRAGHLSCYFCKTVISEANLHAVFPHEKNIRVVCDNPECVKALAQLMAAEPIANG